MIKTWILFVLLGLSILTIGCRMNASWSVAWQEGELIDDVPQCPVCARKGIKSDVWEVDDPSWFCFIQYTFLDTAGTKAYWDTSGIYHPKTFKTIKKSWRKFKCSNGHRFQITKYTNFEY